MMTTALTLLLLTQAPELDHRRELAALPCATLDRLLVRQSVYIVRLMDKFERTCRDGNVARDTHDPVCKGLSSMIIAARTEADDVEFVLERKCGGD